MTVRNRNFQAVALTWRYHGRHTGFVATLLTGVLAVAFVLAACAAPAPQPTAAPPAPPAPPAAAAPFVPGPTLAGGPPGAVAPDAVDAVTVQFTSEGGTIKAYQARPKSGGPFPGLIVIHENRGLTDHIKDVARRFANQGYTALAVDLLSRVGGTDQFTTTDAAVAAIGKLDPNGITQDLNAAVAYLKGQSFVKADRLGVIGYCWGGGNSLRFATNNKDLRAAVVYYGPNPATLDDVANITASVLGIYGELDTRLTVNVPTLAEAMKKYGKSFEYKVYSGAAHAFFNDTGERHNREAAAEAWPLTLAFLEKNLKQ
ncbi:MAG: dienelactone hydrolase family protein [Chloroflexi bacterium]|nr:dienelactone hydrolase family protein [Chloroflexota bacterium]